MCSVACRLYTLRARRHERYGLWLLHAIAVPLGVLVFPLGYFLCFHPVGGSLVQFVYRNIIKRCCGHMTSLNFDGEPSMTLLRATAPMSNRISQPSTTFFYVPHSDQPSEGSHAAVSDTGYGSTSLLH